MTLLVPMANSSTAAAATARHQKKLISQTICLFGIFGMSFPFVFYGMYFARVFFLIILIFHLLLDISASTCPLL